MHRLWMIWQMCLLACLADAVGALPAAETLPGTQPLTLTGDLSEQMVTGLNRFLDRELTNSLPRREALWQRDFSSPEAYAKSVATNRARLARDIGAIDPVLAATEFEYVSGTVHPALVADTETFTAYAVRWPVFAGVHGEGLLLDPKTPAQATVVALPDADQTPEQLCGLAPGIPAPQQFARRLAAAGCRVLIPVLINRDTAGSGSAVLNRWTNLPHREWLWRMAWEVGRHPVGFEVQKVRAAIPLLGGPVGIIGHGEGGMIALYCGALEERIRATVVSGFFRSRQKAYEEPQYRAVWNLLGEFGDAEIATLIAPRALFVEHSPSPNVTGPPPHDAQRRNIAAPGVLATPDFREVEAEVERARKLAGTFSEAIRFRYGPEGTMLGPGGNRTLDEFLAELGITTHVGEMPVTTNAEAPVDFAARAAQRQLRQLNELVDHTQRLLVSGERTRGSNFWKIITTTNAKDWAEGSAPYRETFSRDVIGTFTNAAVPLNPRSRVALGTNGLPLVTNTAAFTAHDLVLDVFPDVFAWGVLLLPTDLKEGERRPVVVCQHGLEGLPEHCLTEDRSARAYASYKAFAARLAERGFVVFAPHNPYRGGDQFRLLQRKANLLGKALFSLINTQHARILDWLGAQPFVDPQRIGYYGLSYGGKSAMRIPAVDTRYCLSICSGDFNEWVRKNAAVDYPSSYLYTHEYEIFEWDLAHSYNYAEMAALIAPRPFMVERGHYDGVGVDEWVDYEYAKVRRFYAQLGLADRTEIEHFPGPHTINGRGTFDFLHRHLRWPKR
jgi:dienelactone hydrolase